MNGKNARVSTPLLVAMALVSALAVALVTVMEGWNPVAVDYGIFWRAAHRSISTIYKPGKYFVYPPPAIPLFRIFKFLPFWTGYVCWTVVSASLYFLAARRLTDTKTALVAIFSSACLQNLLYGQTPMLLSAGLLYAVSLSSLSAGALVGCIACIKPQIFLMAPLVMAVRRDWRALIGMALGGIGAVIFTLAIYGLQLWLDWIRVIPSWAKAIIDLGIIRHVITPSSIGIRLGFNPDTWWFAGTCLAVASVLRLSRRVQGAQLAALIVGASALSVPYALPHDLAGAMPALAALILSGPTAVVFTIAVMLYIGLLLPIIVPIAAAVAASRRSILLNSAAAMV